jgi:hypothetical protein
MQMTYCSLLNVVEGEKVDRGGVGVFYKYIVFSTL